MLYQCRKTVSRRRRGIVPSGLALLILLLAPASIFAQTTFAQTSAAQPDDAERPVPILTGNAGTFSFVTGGQNLIDTQIQSDSSRASRRSLAGGVAASAFEGMFQRPPGGGPYGGPVTKHIDYAQIDYIASPYVTVTAGRFLTPFGIFNERLYPVLDSRPAAGSSDSSDQYRRQ